MIINAVPQPSVLENGHATLRTLEGERISPRSGKCLCFLFCAKSVTPSVTLTVSSVAGLLT